jgi:CRISPR-associated protein Csx3
MGDKVVIKTEEDKEFTIISFTLSENIEPSILREITPPKINSRKGLIISGRGPIWLYGFLIHYYHSTPFIAVYDPRLGAVVIETHVPSIKVGDVLDIYIDGEG